MKLFFFRFSPVLFLFFIPIFDFELIFIVYSFLFFHVFYGFKAIIRDYIHQNEIFIILNLLLKLIFLFILTFMTEIIF